MPGKSRCKSGNGRQIVIEAFWSKTEHINIKRASIGQGIKNLLSGEAAVWVTPAVKPTCATGGNICFWDGNCGREDNLYANLISTCNQEILIHSFLMKPIR